MSDQIDIPEVAKNPNLRYEIYVQWIEDRPTIYTAVDWKLDNDVYYVFVENSAIPEMAGVRTVWVKHPDLKSVSITPFIKEDV